MALTASDEAKNHRWNYVFSRPTTVPPKPYVIARYTVGDCSKGCQFVCFWSDAPDPMDNGWSEWGNSTTIYYALDVHITAAELQTGDIILFGYINGEKHACMVYEVGKDAQTTLVWNFGEDGEPVIHPLQDEIDAHYGMTMTFCKLMPDDPAPPPTPQDKLRALTGYYSWAAWYLGEGKTTFKPYGPRNKTVRPHVPKIIPPTWWVRLTKQLAGRKKGNPNKKVTK